MTDFEHLLTRDGELSELTLMRLEAGELDGEELAFVEERVSSSLPDRRHVEQLRAFVADNPILAPPELAPPAPGLERGWWRSWRGLSLAAAAAAVLVILVRPGQPSLGIAEGEMPVSPEASSTAPAEPTRTKGSAFDLRVQLEDRGDTRYAEPGGAVHPGDRVQFTVHAAEAGHVMVIGVGPDGEVYPAHPREPGHAVPLAPGKETALVGALAFDDQLGPERFVGIWCPQTFSYAEVAARLGPAGASFPHFRDGCIQSALTLQKRERGEPDPEGPDAVDAFDPLGNVLDEDEDAQPRPPDAAVEDPDGELEDEEDAEVIPQ